MSNLAYGNTGTDCYAALAKLARSINQTSDPGRLLEKAGALAVRSLDLDFFGAAERGDRGRCHTRLWRMANVASRQIGECKLPASPAESAFANAIDAGCAVTFSNLSQQTDFGDRFLSGNGITSGVVAPLTNAGQEFGAVGVFGRGPREFHEEEMLFVESVAHLLGAATACQRAQSQVDEQNRFISASIDAMESILLILRPDGRITKTNQACERISQFSLREVRNRSIWSAFLIPEEAGLMSAAFQQLDCGEEPVKLETYLLTKLGDRLRIAWSLSATRDDGNGLQSIIASGIDITQQFEALEKLNQLDAAPPLGAEANGAARGERPPGVTRDRRQHRRRACPYFQKLAPLVDGVLPGLDDFSEVRCRDISSRGFAFLLPEPPKHDKFVIAFGAPPSQIYLRAHIVYVTRTRVDGQEMFVVGCCYSGRVHYSKR